MEGALADGRGQVLPGVLPLLEAIAGEPSWVPALLTGNTGAMARLKLGHFGLADAFAYGAFGDEAANRDALACRAVSEVENRWGKKMKHPGTYNGNPLSAAAGVAALEVVANGEPCRVANLAAHRDLLLDGIRPSALLHWAGALSADGDGAA
jgi:hypothetical protein